MMYLELALYLNSLSAELKIILLQVSLLIFEIAYFFWLRNFFNVEEKRLINY